MELFNFEKNRLEVVPDDQVTDALRSGQFGAQRGSTIPVVLQDGRRGSIPAEKAFQAFSSGFARFHTQAEQEDEARREFARSRTGQLLGSAASVARGATLGLSDVLLTRGDSPRALERKAFLAAFRDEHPNASLSLDLLGAVVPGFLTGGASIGARATTVGAKAGAANLARKTAALTPAGAVFRMGRGIENQLAGAIAGRSGVSQASLSLGQRIAPRAVGSAVEGAAFASGGLLSESVLGDLDLTAESVVATVGFGAFVGGAAGAALALPGALSQKAFTASKQQFQKTVQQVRDQAEELAQKAAKARGKAGQEFASQAEDVLRNVSDEVAQAARLPNPRSQYYTPGDIAPFNSLESAAAAAGAVTREEARWFLRGSQRVRTAPESPQFLDIVEDAVTRPQTGMGAALDSVMRKLDDDFIPRVTIRYNVGDAASYTNNLIKQRMRIGIGDRSKDADVRILQRHFKELKDRHGILNKNVSAVEMRQELLRLRAKIPPKARIGAKQHSLANEALLDLEKFYMAQLRRDPVYGQQINDLFQEAQKLIKSKKVIENMIKTQKPERIMRELAAKFDGTRAPRFNARAEPNELQALADLGPFVRWQGNQVSLDTLFKDSILRQKLVNSGAITDQAARNAQVALLQSIAGTAVGANLMAAQRRLTGVREIAAFTRGKLFDQLTKPGDNVFKSVFTRMKGLEDIKSGIEKRIRAGATNFKEATRSGVAVPTFRITTGVAPGAVKALQEFSFRDDRKVRDRDPATATMEVAEELRQVIQNPRVFAENLSQQLEPVADIAPETAFLLQDHTMRSIAFLNSVAPKDPFAGDLVRRKYHPNDREVQGFAKYLEAVQNPLQIVDDFAAGVMSPQQAEVLHNLFPGMQRFMMDAVLDEISDGGVEPNTQAEIALSLLFGVPVSQLLSSRFIQSMQMMLEAPEETGQTQGQGPGGLRFTGLDKLKSNERKETELERAQRGITD